ncbi:uncharacterized protein FIBRA_07002 [Fibroporia radiculosa]|uniref:Protein kinase domain-containing protein n=1 Tax=Fibroporia radiculosa TaxID=599839 RepID=J4H4D6_9APHY|nr:uncharacterized protein FIBRA_07002 [Fibroporia radiculosa]CCM04809.1 predicted protein [Fibroporia radiculosa]
MIQESEENHYKLDKIDDHEPDPYVVPPYSTMHVQDDIAAAKHDVSEHDLDDMNDFARRTALLECEHLKSNIPKLEEFIPSEYFPNILLVNDTNDLVSGTGCRFKTTRYAREEKPSRLLIEYERVWPVFDRDVQSNLGVPSEAKTVDVNRLAPKATQLRVARLHLSASSLIGVGHHSTVYRGIAVKIAGSSSSARGMLEKEANIYNKLPKHLMEDWNGFNLVTPHKYPVPADAVVPKFYGYHVPKDPYIGSCHLDRSPILLVEECGVPIRSYGMNPDEWCCLTHVLRLHYANFIQNFLYERNILIQPGPLSHPPSERSFDRPSFRIIDFGRAERLED